MSFYYLSLQSRVTFLTDNAQDSTYLYLISVLTGMHKASGTKATVSIKLVGVQGESAKNVLENHSARLFKTGSEDWFLLAETSCLGKLTSIVLSIHYTNKQHNWYVHTTARIYIYIM